ncbi:hypothetical protein [Glutamicibacter sp. AOP33-2CA-4]|uniref:hypothetical protein n=1 Tax=Glutamicibacter sp. AOP33-2CA-4 TaxID=3457690 RepID=UPI0040338E80
MANGEETIVLAREPSGSEWRWGTAQKMVKAISQKHNQVPLGKDNNFDGGFDEIDQKADRRKNFFGRFDLYLRGF